MLTGHPRIYERTSNDLTDEIPPGTVVRRAFALDTARHLSQGGRYVGAMARPGRWVIGAELSRRTELALRVLGDASLIRAASRRGRTEALAKLLDGITRTATRP